MGRSIFYTTFGETRLARDLDVAVAGGGNSAGQAAIHLAAFARRVTLVVRGASLETRNVGLPGAADSTTPNIELRLQAEIVGAEGDELMEADRSATERATPSRPFQRSCCSF